MSEPLMPGPGRATPPPRRFGRRTLQIAGVVVIAVVLGLVLTFCAKSGASGGGGGRGGGPGGRGRPATTVGIATVVQGAIPITLSALGTVTPMTTVNVNARVSGMLDSVAFREGQSVAKGQLLAQIDPRPFQTALQLVQGQLRRDQALLQEAKLDLTRYRTLKSQDSIAGQTVDTQGALVKQDEATVSADQANVGAARLNLSFTRVTAPVAGKVGLRQIDPGNQIVANAATPIAVVTQIDPITVVFSLPQEDIPAVNKPRGAGLAVTAYDRAGGTVLATGTLATLDNIIDTTTGTVKAKARFANSGGALFPNQFVNVILLVDTLRNQAIVPTTAIRHGPRGDYAWVLQPDQTARSRLVKVGPGTAETVSIISGLKLGETVITDGGDKLRDGAAVVLPGKNPAGGGAGGRHRRGGPGGGGRHRGQGAGAPGG